MKILDDVYIIGGGIYGIGLSSRLDCNIFLIDCGTESVLIDAGVGDNTEKIIENVSKEPFVKSKVKKLFLTHAHLDHSGGAAKLKKLLGLEVYMSEIEAGYIEKGDEAAIGLDKAKRSMIYPGDYGLTPVKIDYHLKNGEVVNVGNYDFRVINTPGHSKGSTCFLLKSSNKNILFSGDVIFLGGFISLQNLPDSSLADYAAGMNNLKDLSIDTLLPSHYGFTIENGQYHIDQAIIALEGLTIPKLI